MGRAILGDILIMTADSRARKQIQTILTWRVVVETFGGWDSEAVKFLKDMARLSARRWRKNNADEIKFLFQRLPVSLQRGNAALLIARDVDSAAV